MIKMNAYRYNTWSSIDTQGMDIKLMPLNIYCANIDSRKRYKLISRSVVSKPVDTVEMLT